MNVTQNGRKSVKKTIRAAGLGYSEVIFLQEVDCSGSFTVYGMNELM